jgi:glutathione S-transferase
MTAPTLYVFAISHYCEKARWALDHFGIAYELHHTMPGKNRGIAKQLGASNGSLPFLRVGSAVVEGSAAIVDWGEQHRRDGMPSLAGSDAAQLASLEKRLDELTGVHIRRYYYSDALLADPGSVRPIFSRDLPFFQKLGVTLGWSMIVPMMIKGMDLGVAQGAESRDILVREMDWLDGVLADGRPYLTGDAFTRADVTAASLLAPLVNPERHPTYAALSLPPVLAETIGGWQQRPILRWVSKVYSQHR